MTGKNIAAVIKRSLFPTKAEVPKYVVRAYLDECIVTFVQNVRQIRWERVSKKQRIFFAKSTGYYRGKKATRPRGRGGGGFLMKALKLNVPRPEPSTKRVPIFMWSRLHSRNRIVRALAGNFLSIYWRAPRIFLAIELLV